MKTIQEKQKEIANAIESIQEACAVWYELQVQEAVQHLIHNYLIKE